MSRALKMRHIVAAEIYDFVRRGGLDARFQFDKGAGRFAPFVVGLGDDGGGEDGGVFIEYALNLDGGNVFAAGNDDVLGSILKLDIAVGLHDAEITGMEPAAG